MKRFRFFAVIVVLVLSLAPTSAALAQGPGPDGGRVIFGQHFTLESEDTFDGNLVVFGGNVEIETGAELNGSLVVFGGTIVCDGVINGDVVAVGGQIALNDAAIVVGDVVTVGGQVERAEGAEVKGEIINNVQPPVDFPNGHIPPVEDKPSPVVNIGISLFGQIAGIFSWAIVGAVSAMLVSLFWKPHVERAGQAIVSQPVMAGAVGLAAFVISLILVLTVLPLIFLGFAWLFGIFAIGSEVGSRFARAMNQPWPPVLMIGVGTFLLVAVAGAAGLVPCLGGVAQTLLGFMGIGGALMSRFGTRAVQGPGLTVSVPPAEAGTQS